MTEEMNPKRYRGLMSRGKIGYRMCSNCGAKGKITFSFTGYVNEQMPPELFLCRTCLDTFPLAAFFIVPDWMKTTQNPLATKPTAMAEAVNAIKQARGE